MSKKPGHVIKTWTTDEALTTASETHLIAGGYGSMLCAIGGGILFGPIGVIGGFFAVNILSTTGLAIATNTIKNRKFKGHMCSCGSRFLQNKVGMCGKHQEFYVYLKRNKIPHDIRRLTLRMAV